MRVERINAFTDGVIAIIITIMVLELKAPHAADAAALVTLAPPFLSYVLSFIYVAIYWNNHHHLMHACARTDGKMMWANMHLLFWLSLIPFATAWMGENHFAPLPTAVYGLSLLMPAIAYYILQRIILRHCADPRFASALSDNFKAKLSPVLYIAGIALSFFAPWAAWMIYAAVALMWVIPDKRIEAILDMMD